MKWTPGRRSANLKDLRGSTGRGISFGGGAVPKLGCGGFVLLLLLSVLFGQDFFSLLGGGVGPGGAPAGVPGQEAPVSASPEEERLASFVSFVLDDSQETWNRIFAQAGQTYPPATLALFRDSVRSGCGYAEAAMGPFYCPRDQTVYIDLGFYEALQSRFGAPGDFAQAYVIAHEIGHHVQNVLGITNQGRGSNEASIRLELQADCFAGIWGHSTAQRNILESGDIEEGLGAAAAVGDDRIQRQSGGWVNPETWTHGSAEQRAFWFRRGLETGDFESCNTFEAGL
ncbi:MAG TPA: neutral zinc metallopeptidase [Thermoanaerobaculia bacterium]|nr:neutral zinc metallopeptidase [Thermoanaerobaculia bacterium]